MLLLLRLSLLATRRSSCRATFRYYSIRQHVALTLNLHGTLAWLWTFGRVKMMMLRYQILVLRQLGLNLDACAWLSLWLGCIATKVLALEISDRNRIEYLIRLSICRIIWISAPALLALIVLEDDSIGVGSFLNLERKLYLFLRFHLSWIVFLLLLIVILVVVDEVGCLFFLLTWLLIWQLCPCAAWLLLDHLIFLETQYFSCKLKLHLVLAHSLWHHVRVFREVPTRLIDKRIVRLQQVTLHLILLILQLKS